MGNLQNSSEPDYFLLLSNYTLLEKITHEIFGEITIYTHKKTQALKFAEKVFCLTKEENYENSLELLKLKYDVSWPNYCKILGHSCVIRNDCFGEVFVHRFFVEYYEPENLKFYDEQQLGQSLIPDRCRPETEAWNILFSLVSLASFFRRYKIYIEDVSPRNVVVTSEGEVKFIDMHVFSLKVTALERVDENTGYVTAFSPEQLESLTKPSRESRKSIDQEKSDVFAIGMTILCMISYEWIDSFYDFSSYSLHFDRVYKKIVKARRAKYSDQLMDLIVSMLNSDPEQRPTIRELVDKIQGIVNPLRMRGVSEILVR
jgi:serine/threonine protein kinase